MQIAEPLLSIKMPSKLTHTLRYQYVHRYSHNRTCVFWPKWTVFHKNVFKPIVYAKVSNRIL